MLQIKSRKQANPPFLLTRHPSYQTHAFDVVLHWLRTNARELVADFHSHWLGDALPDRNDFRLCIPWLQDPIQHWSSEAFAQAIQLSEWCDDARIPVINRPECLAHAGKASTATRLAEQGLRTPRTELICDESRFRRAHMEIPLPLFVREDWGHGGSMILLRTRQEVRDLDLEQFRRPVAVEWIDVSCDGLFRKYRYLAAGECGLSHHLQVSRSWITRGTDRLKSDSLRNEEVAYLKAADPNHEELQRARKALGLEMVAFDYGYDQTGRMVVWEANPFPHIRFSRRSLKYRNFAIHASIRAILCLYYARAGLPIPEAISGQETFNPPYTPDRWRRPLHRLTESLGRYRRALADHLGEFRQATTDDSGSDGD